MERTIIVCLGKIQVSLPGFFISDQQHLRWEDISPILKKKLACRCQPLSVITSLSDLIKGQRSKELTNNSFWPLPFSSLFGLTDHS